MRILLLADIHIGAIKDHHYVYSVLEEIIDQELNFTKTDAVIILGDYFDRVFKANDDNTALAINIMSKLVRTCIKNKVKLRIVYGTESHEMSQYRLFNYHMTSHKVDMKLFTTVTEEELFPGYNVLYLPEEYIDDKSKHYANTLYSGKHYNAIFGHGVIIEGMPMVISSGSDDKKSKEKKVPRFKVGELTSIADAVIFGHYHIHTDIGNNAQYVGSLFRWKFGEDPAKGYGILEDGKFSFVPNDRAWTLKTYDYASSGPIYTNEGILAKEIDKIKAENPEVFGEGYHGKIRMRLTVPKDLDPTFRDKLSTILMDETRIIPMFMNIGDTLMEEVKEELAEEEDYLIDPNLNVFDKIHKYSHEHYESQMSLNKITSYIKDALSRA